MYAGADGGRSAFLVMVSLLPSREQVLEGVVRHRITELRSNGQQLVRAINQLLEHTIRREAAMTRRVLGSAW